MYGPLNTTIQSLYVSKWHLDPHVNDVRIDFRRGWNGRDNGDVWLTNREGHADLVAKRQGQEESVRHA